MRTESMFRCILDQIEASCERFIRILHFSVQSNHIHLLIEADDRGLLARGMKGFAVRVARHLNKLLGVRGEVFSDRYHAHSLATPREVRNALVYILRNWTKHTGRVAIDPCSSARYLVGGWDEITCPPAVRGSPDTRPVAPPETWLAKEAIGRIRAHDVLAA